MMSMIKRVPKSYSKFFQPGTAKNPKISLVFNSIFGQFMFPVYGLEYYTVVGDMKAVKCQIKILQLERTKYCTAR
jgi:hypothetical protein